MMWNCKEHPWQQSFQALRFMVDKPTRGLRLISGTKKPRCYYQSAGTHVFTREPIVQGWFITVGLDWLRVNMPKAYTAAVASLLTGELTLDDDYRKSVKR